MTVAGKCPISISVQHEDFSLQTEADKLRQVSNNIGAIVTFSGLVRELHGEAQVQALTLEHYPGMTENSLQDIAVQATQRWSLQAVSIIHRVGELPAGAQIVYVGVASAHRQAAFAAAEFIMDFLKTRAPFWKKCREPDQEYWVEAKDSDDQAAARWQQDSSEP